VRAGHVVRGRNRPARGAGAPSLCRVYQHLPVHLETLRTVEEVARAKFELLSHLPEDGMAVFCADDPVLRRKALELGSQSRTYGIEQSADLRGLEVRLEKDGVRFRLEDGLDVALPMFGDTTCTTRWPHSAWRASSTWIPWPPCRPWPSWSRPCIAPGYWSGQSHADR